MSEYYDPNSIVDQLKKRGVDSSLENRRFIYHANYSCMAPEYKGTDKQNEQMLKDLKRGELNYWFAFYIKNKLYLNVDFLF